ncbi:hypothetical protein AUEXF2481DRAFT_188364 [Aureobasidium subglaciale EXF-2481]|uniref:Uncharacterized protein n=1 Tax=Aureobasidium subglaciale (strain EXF-2481) TaxID=1043005 RepID=A0A074YPP6_AURSE|nr:uncharacterized protein AUEXF2481DRAFT_188364 [Aureobasidium subglaciale EXF-2481]KEQ99645.1 hypothetical protein AUEXF2481DRAFT_188364 [Aureobasidium subglaciale EXF-2481]
MSPISQTPKLVFHHRIDYAVHTLCRTFATASINCLPKKMSQKEYNAAYYQANREKLHELNARWRANNKEKLAKYQMQWYRNLESRGPEVVERCLRRARERVAAIRADPVKRQKIAEAYKLRYATGPYRPGILMRSWVLNCSDLDAFRWKTHTPIIHAQAVRQTCASCGKSNRRGSRLWWRRHQETSSADLELYDCHSCYTKDIKAAMPMGFEGHVWGFGATPKP